MCAVLQAEGQIAKGIELQSSSLLFGAASFPSEPVLGRLRPNFGAAIRTLTVEMEAIARRLIRCRSREEYRQELGESFQTYQQLSFAIGSIIEAALKGIDHARLVEESLELIEKKFCSEENGYLGADEKREIAFSISTLKSAYRLLPVLLSRPVRPETMQEERKLSEGFAGYVLIFQLSLICMQMITLSGETVIPEVLEEIIEGFRSSVMAYSCVRQALDLRGFSEDRYREEVKDVVWDEEDRSFADF